MSTPSVESVETLIIGAGVIGSSVAMHLARLGMEGIRVIDFDLEGSLSSSELNAGGVRATWVQPIHVQMSRITIDFLAEHAAEVGYRDVGYLWLHPADRLPGALRARDTQVGLGWPVEAWDVAELRRRVPFIDKTDGIAGAIFAPRDGLVNPNLLKNHFRAGARELGVRFDDRTLCRSAEYDSSGRIRITAERLEPLAQEEKIEILSGSSPKSATTVHYSARTVINCAGAWAPQISRMLAYDCPSHPVRRQACIFDCRDVDLTRYGMIVDTSGVYLHPEASNGLAGLAIHSEPWGVNYHYDGESFFLEHIWPALYERSSAFERLRHLTGWAGIYEVSPDEAAILGRVENGEAGRNGRVFEAHSFSGHGVMHSHAAGLLLAERIVHGAYRTLDAEPLNGNRFASGRLIRESLII